MKKNGVKRQFFVWILALALAIVSLGTTVDTRAEASETENAEDEEETKAVVDESVWEAVDALTASVKSAYQLADNENLLADETFLTSAGTAEGNGYAFAVGRLGEDEDYQAYLSALETFAQEQYDSEEGFTALDVTEWQQIALTMLSLGGDPGNMGRDGNGDYIDLVSDCIWYVTDNYGFSVEEMDLNTLVWTLTALDSMYYELPDDCSFTRSGLLQQILSFQNADGGFSSSDTEADSSDPEMTAMVLRTLAPYGVSENYESGKISETLSILFDVQTIKDDVLAAVEDALSYLSDAQQDDGTFLSEEEISTPAAAQVLTALCSLGIDTDTDERFIKNGTTLTDVLMAYQQDEDSAGDMSTDTAVLCAYAAYIRSKCGYANLYDFTGDEDSESYGYVLDLETGEEKETNVTVEFDDDDIMAYRTLPSEITTAYEREVALLYNKLLRADNKASYTTALEGLRQKQSEIESIKSDISEINLEIQMYYMTDSGISQLTAEDAYSLLDAIDELSEYDQQFVDDINIVNEVADQLIGRKRSTMLIVVVIIIAVIVVANVLLSIRDRKRKKKKKAEREENLKLMEEIRRKGEQL